ncbi:MAG: hypothetical protein EOP56_16580 [Sphingobacteriales bacterium]|nr:MAG: hypothetical protein EOP56_16580 [Sphingobacteriales bacterium]
MRETKTSYNEPGSAYRFEYLEYINVISDGSRVTTPELQQYFLTQLSALEHTLKHLEKVGIDATVIFSGTEVENQLHSYVTVDCTDLYFKKVLMTVVKRFCGDFSASC